jgi:hypothetical protein
MTRQGLAVKKPDGMIVDYRLGGVPRYFLTPPADYHMRVPSHIVNCVVFLGPREGDQLTYRATGFFVGVKSEAEPDRVYSYLATAAHFVDGLAGRPFAVRLNTEDGRSRIIESGARAQWVFHPEGKDHADIAIVPFALPEDSESLCVPSTMFYLGGDSVGLGDEVFISGLFSLASGRMRNTPIVRTGTLAMMPEDKIRGLKYGYGELEAYLIEARSLAGISGAPVFVRRGAYMDWDLNRHSFFLLGMTQGHWNLNSGSKQDMLPASDAQPEGDKTNMGVAIVTPARVILETLNSEVLVLMRKARDEARARTNPPVED